MLEYGGTRGRNSLVVFGAGLVLMAVTWAVDDGPAVSTILVTAVGFFGVLWVYGEGPPEGFEQGSTDSEEQS